VTISGLPVAVTYEKPDYGKRQTTKMKAFAVCFHLFEQ